MCAAYTCRTSPDWRGSHLVASCHIPPGAVLLTEAPAATTCGDDESESVEAALAKALLESGRGSDWAARFAAAPQQRGGEAAPPISDEALRRLCASGVDEVAALAVYDAVRHNAFGLETPLLGVEHGAAFYETAAKLNHSCDPNCLSIRLGGNFALFAVAAIEEGSELFHSYLPPRLLVLPRRARRAHLHFPCRCSRCEAEPKEPPPPLAQLGWPAAHAATAEGHLVGRFSLLCAGGAPREVVAAGAGLLSNAPLVSTLRQRPLAALQVCLPLLASSWQARAMGGADAAADDEGGWCVSLASDLAAAAVEALAAAAAAAATPAAPLALLRSNAAIGRFLLSQRPRRETVPALLDSLASLASVSALPLGAWLRDDTAFLGGGDAARALCAAAEAVATEAAEAAAEAGGPLRSSELLRRPRIAALGLLREPCAWAGCAGRRPGSSSGGGRDAAPPACLRCSRCKGVLYCSAVCQRADWPSHRNHCTPVAAVSGSDAAAAGISRLSVAGGGGRRAELAAASGGGGDGGGDDDPPRSLLADHESLQALLAAARAPHVVAKVDALLDALRELGASGADARHLRLASQLVEQARPLLSLHLAAARWALHQTLGLHGSLLRLEIVLLGTFGELFAKGYCTASPDEDGEGGGGGNGGADDNAEGTGMGSGEGKKDVSDQLQEEGQLDGDDLVPEEEAARGEEGRRQEGKEEERAKDEEGVEMTNDFDGEMMDLEQPDEARGSDEEGETQDEPEHAMGELDELNQEVVDERLWDGDQEDELQPKGDEKVERDAEVAPGAEAQLEAKEEAEEEEGQTGKKRKREEEEEAQPAAEKEAPDGAEGGEDPPAEEEEAAEEGRVKAETEYEDSHYKDPSRPTPGEEEEEGGEEAGEMPEEAPEQMDADDADGAGEEAEGGADDDGGADAPPAAEEAAAPEGREGEEEEEEGTGEAPPLDEGAEADEEAEEPSALPGGAAEEEEEEADAAPDAEEAAGEEGEATTARREYDEQQVYEGEGGRYAAGEAAEAERADEAEAQGERHADEAAAQAAAARSGAGEREGGERAQQQQAGPQQQGGPPPRSQRSRPQPNPFDALGDALQSFHRQLQLLQRAAPAEEAGPEPPADSPPEQGGGGGDEPPADGEFEVVGRNEASDTQVLADADEPRLAQEEGAPPPPEEAAEAAADDPADESGGAGAEPAPAPEEEEAAAEMDVDPSAERRAGRRRGGALADGAAEAAEAAEGGADGGEEEAWDVEREAAADAEDAGRVGAPAGGRLAGAEEEEAAAEEEAAQEAALREEAEDAADKLARMREELERQVAGWQLGGERAVESEALWRRYEALTAPLSQELCEQLRLILEATVASKLQGDYRTGKRISMRKVIPYIASGFRKDKIWLRRTKPSQRQYQVMLCIDDSESMRSTGAGGLACEALALLCGALSRLEVGQLAVASFAERVRLLHPFDRPFSAEAGAYMLSRFSFAEKETDMEGLLRTVVQTLRLAREQQRAAAEQMQLAIIVSDGRRSPSWGDPSLWVRRAAEENILLCFVIVDAAANKDSILELKSVSYPGGKLTISSWIDAFPFPYYIVLRELRALPHVLSDALRQWIELVSGMS